MESYSVQAVLSVADKGFTSKISGAANSVSQLDGKSKKASVSVMDIAKGVGSFRLVQIGVDALKNSLSGAISRFDTMNQYPKVMEQIGFSSEDSNKSIKRLSEGIDGLPTSLDGIVSSTQNIAILTRDLDMATETSIALNDAFLASGASTDEANRGLTQYVQMLSKGQVDMQSWRTLQETMGPALYDVAAAFGFAGSSATTDFYGALKSGEISFNQFNSKLIELDGGVNGFAERARTASAGIATSFQNLQTAVVRGMENVIRTADNSLRDAGLPNLQQSIEIFKGKVNDGFSVAAQVTERFVKIAAPGIKLVSSNMSVLVPVIGTATGGFLAFKVAMEIQSTANKFKGAMKNAVTTITAFQQKEQLAEKALKMTKAAQDRAALAAVAEAKALQARTVASKLSTEATKAQRLADQAAGAVKKAKVVTEEMEAKAAVQQAAAERAAVAAANARAQAEIKGAAAVEAKALAERTEMAATKLNTASEEANAAAAGASSLAIIAKTAVLGVLSGEMTIATAVQYAWNAAMAANPIGAVIVAITAMVAAIVAVVKIVQKLNEHFDTLSHRSKEAKKSTKELSESLEESKNEFKDSYKETKNSAGAIKNYASEVINLVKSGKKDAQTRTEIKSKVEALNNAIDDLNLAYDEQTGKLNMTTQALEAYASSYEKQAKSAAIAERLMEIEKEQL